MSDLAEFLLARYAEAAQAATRCSVIYPAPWDVYDRGYVAYVKSDGPNYHRVMELEQEQDQRGSPLAAVALALSGRGFFL